MAQTLRASDVDSMICSPSVRRSMSVVPGPVFSPGSRGGLPLRSTQAVRQLDPAWATRSDSEEFLQLAIQGAGIGTFDTDLRRRRSRFSPELCKLLELAPRLSLSNPMCVRDAGPMLAKVNSSGLARAALIRSARVR